MQPNEITLAVDVLNNGTTENQTYARFEEFLNRSIYIGSDHSLCLRNTLGLYRTLPKQSGNFKGVAKSSFKFSQDVVVDGVDGVSSITSPLILEVSFSVPVGATAADVLELRQRALALIDADTVMTPLNLTLMV